MHGNTFKGKRIEALEATSNIALGVVSLDELEHFGIRQPAPMAKTGFNKTDPRDRDLKILREALQRAWDKPRSDRADVYARYIQNLLLGTVQGGTPPITLYINEQGVVENGAIHFSYDAMPVAIDGETQLEARFRLRAHDLSEGGELNVGDVQFPVVIYHGIPEEQAMQILHDFNHYAKPIPESKLGMRNSAGGMSKIIETAVSQVKGATLNTGPKGGKKHVASFVQVMSFATGFAMGTKALQRNGASWFDELNRPGTPPLNSGCEPALVEMVALAQGTPDIRSLSNLIWQVAGVLAQEGHSPVTLKWSDGITAFQAASVNTGTGAGKGGNKGPISDRLRALYNAMRP